MKNLNNRHFLQSNSWQTVREALGRKIFNIDNVYLQASALPFPFTGKYIGYIPRADLQTINWRALYETARTQHCLYVQIDPDNHQRGVSPELPSWPEYVKQFSLPVESYQIRKNHSPVHMQRNVVLDLNPSEEDLLAGMKQKSRYNVRLALRKGVKVTIDDKEESFHAFLQLYTQTMNRQEYTGRNAAYVEKVWQILRPTNTPEKKVVAIANASYEGTVLVSWLLFLHEDTIYYPYGGSSDLHRNVMPAYALVWELILWGKQRGYRQLDLWGMQPDERDGYSRFKGGFTDERVLHYDSMDLIIDPFYYSAFKLLQGLRERSTLVKKLISR